jgi:hypothetical protein
MFLAKTNFVQKAIYTKSNIHTFTSKHANSVGQKPALPKSTWRVRYSLNTSTMCIVILLERSKKRTPENNLDSRRAQATAVLRRIRKFIFTWDEDDRHFVRSAGCSPPSYRSRTPDSESIIVEELDSPMLPLYELDASLNIVLETQNNEVDT